MNFIFSKFAADEDWQDLLKEFIAEIPQRMHALDSAVAEANLDKLEILVHQLKGACGSYGFDGVTPLALELEEAMKRNRDMDAWHSEFVDFRNILLGMTDQAAPRSHA